MRGDFYIVHFFRLCLFPLMTIKPWIILIYSGKSMNRSPNFRFFGNFLAGIYTNNLPNSPMTLTIIWYILMMSTIE
uniref:Uncharacterized protein n=1 Tax=Candidatus Kentrum sp. TC TaxID=2126339 RepID=A0A450YU02_9GAMM|nr:MAG: hypothetical protein BECKTC1821D_GA0114238_102313 [Candidatus Kentron sp. TC]